jgi:hypothetical protein
VLDELIPSAWHHVEQYANNPIEADHGRLKHRLRPMHGLQTDRTTEVIIAGHAFMQNLRRGHYELGIDAPPARRVAAAFGELARLQNHTVLCPVPTRPSPGAAARRPCDASQSTFGNRK